MAQDWGFGESTFDFLKGLTTFTCPRERNFFSGEAIQWLRDLAVIFDEASVEVGEAEERLDAFHGGKCSPVTDDSGLAWVHFHAFGTDYKAEKLRSSHTKLALLDVGL
jgi:hypothetical protein